MQRFRDELDDAAALLDAIDDRDQDLDPTMRSGLVGFYVEVGRQDRAAKHLDILAVADFGSLPTNHNFLVASASLAYPCYVLNDVRRAAALYERLAPYEDVLVVAGALLYLMGSAHHHLMLLAATNQSWDDFERHAQLALDCHERLRSPPWLARTQLDLADALLKRNRPDDPQRAEQLLAACIDSSHQIGATALANRASQLLRA